MAKFNISEKTAALLPELIRQAGITNPIVGIEETKTLIRFYLLGHAEPVVIRKHSPGPTPPSKAKGKERTNPEPTPSSKAKGNARTNPEPKARTNPEPKAKDLPPASQQTAGKKRP